MTGAFSYTLLISTPGAPAGFVSPPELNISTPGTEYDQATRGCPGSGSEQTSDVLLPPMLLHGAWECRLLSWTNCRLIALGTMSLCGLRQFQKFRSLLATPLSDRSRPWQPKKVKEKVKEKKQ